MLWIVMNFFLQGKIVFLFKKTKLHVVEAPRALGKTSKRLGPRKTKGKRSEQKL